MQLSDCVVRLAGSLLQTVPKSDVTPAEILVLRAIHGDDAVINIRPTRMDKRSHKSEFDRLSQRYGSAGRLAGPGQEPTVLLDRLFPGAMKRLPVSLDDIGLGDLVAPEPEKEAA